LSLDDYVPGHGDVDLLVVVGDPEHAELTLLTTCRVWRFAEERRHRDPTRLIDASQVRGPLEPSRPLWV
jgi:hypothetical protein